MVECVCGHKALRVFRAFTASQIFPERDGGTPGPLREVELALVASAQVVQGRKFRTSTLQFPPERSAS